MFLNEIIILFTFLVITKCGTDEVDEMTSETYSIRINFTNRFNDTHPISSVTFYPKQVYNILGVTTVSEFLGIPFARPPIDYFRLKRPHPHYGNDTHLKFYANVSSGSCVQKTLNTGIPKFDYYNSKDHMSEDCLKLNIWKPGVNSDAVIVFFHGGDLLRGSASAELYRGHYFAAYARAIIVSANYRLGPYGFAYLGKKTKIPGNMGLLDQTMALRWVNEHIHAFGGNPRKITIFGHEAGGAAAATHLFSGASKGLFKRIILSSGVFPNHRFTVSHKQLIERTRRLSDDMYCKNQTNTLVELCLAQREDNTLRMVISKLREQENKPLRKMFGISSKDKEYFVRDFRKLKMKKDVDILVGTTEDEGTLFYFDYVRDNYKHLEKHNETKEAFMQLVTDINNKLFDKVAKDYNINKEVFKKARAAMKKIVGDREYLVGQRLFHEMHFECDWAKFLERALKKNVKSVYAYRFMHRPKNYDWPEWLPFVITGSDIEFVFGSPFKNYKIHDEKLFTLELIVAMKMMKMFGRFANTGVPDERWVPFSRENKKILILNLNLAKRNAYIFEEFKRNDRCKLFKNY
ncbi:Acetylcholinesterase [Strongyloides ratti]|uniref:Acetylcholinesterase n=1 Tax=Strongyloides ratti TaxID=34506 RepID=A0A090LJA3_STRRB|nr:Acetylcholinesterase [Strongyloides ratti]CEF69917.1 Acetylcholinesterase [Strongyloides ratti]